MRDGKNGDHESNGKLRGKEYERELARLHVEFVKLQQWVVHKGLKVCIIFEGRDGAGKGGTIKAMTERGRSPCYTSPRREASLFNLRPRLKSGPFFCLMRRLTRVLPAFARRFSDE